MNIIIRYGTETISKNYPSAPTVNQVVESESLRAELGYGDNVRAKVNGVEQAGTAYLTDGCTLVLETRANTKAA